MCLDYHHQLPNCKEKKTEKNQTMMNQNQNQSAKQLASLTTSRLSPLAKPFTLNRSSYQPNSSLSPKPFVNSLDHCDDEDPFSSLLDSFRKSNLSCHTVSLHDTTLPVEAASQTQENSLFEHYPFLELPKNGDLDDGVNGLQFDVSLPTNSSPCITRLGYETGKGNDVDNSAGNANMFQKVGHAVDGLNPCLTVSDGVFEKSTRTIVAKDILSNYEGTIQAADEPSSFFISSFKVAPLKLSTDTSSAKSTPQNQSPNDLGDNDTDVDSPCWKGTMAFSLTPPEISGSVQFHHVEKATKKHNSLNPLAPQFFPGIGYIKDDFGSPNSSVPVATSLLSGEDILMTTVMTESPVELNKGVELQHSSNIVCGRENAFNMVNYLQSSSVDPVLTSHYTMTQPSSKEECTTSKGKLVGKVDDFVKGTEKPGASRSLNEVFPAKGHSPTSPTSSYQVNVVTDLLKTFEGFSKSLIESSKPDVKIIINAMHVLSELLAQACEDSVDSHGDHNPDMIMIPQIINNLNDFWTKISGKRISTLDSTPANSPFCLESLDRPLKPTKGLEVASVETLTVPHQLYLQNDYMGKNTVSKVIGQSGQSSFGSSSDEGTKKGNEIAQLQVIRRSLVKSLDFGKQMPPEASLFWNLWLDSEAERCFRKYKTWHWLMEAGVDVNCKNVAELWR